MTLKVFLPPEREGTKRAKTDKTKRDQKQKIRAVIVAQLVQQLLPTHDVRSLNLVIDKIYADQCLLSTVLYSTKMTIKEAGKKRPGKVHF